MSSQNEKKKSKKGALAGAGVVGAAAIAALLFFGNGLGLGRGTGTGETRSIESHIGDAVTSSVDASGAAGTASIPENVTVLIEENKVFVEGQAVEDAAALKTYLERIHNDSRTYTLTEKNAILATHEWVLAVFNELKISLQNT